MASITFVEFSITDERLSFLSVWILTVSSEPSFLITRSLKLRLSDQPLGISIAKSGHSILLPITRACSMAMAFV